jgi:hypothetical protein
LRNQSDDLRQPVVPSEDTEFGVTRIKAELRLRFSDNCFWRKGRRSGDGRE